MRQLQNLQQQMSQQQMKQQQHEMEEKLRKLQEMKQQEEEFDKHLAQTLPVSALTVYNIFLGSEKCDTVRLHAHIIKKKLSRRTYSLILRLVTVVCILSTSLLGRSSKVMV